MCVISLHQNPTGHPVVDETALLPMTMATLLGFPALTGFGSLTLMSPPMRQIRLKQLRHFLISGIVRRRDGRRDGSQIFFPGAGRSPRSNVFSLTWTRSYSWGQDAIDSTQRQPVV